MGTRSIVGVMGRDGNGAATYIASDGYPTGVGARLLAYWNDAESVMRLIEGGSLGEIGVSGMPDTLEYFERHYDGQWVEASESSQRVYYLSGRANDIYPVRLERTEGFFERRWPWDIEYLYLFTPDGWLGCECRMHEGDTHEVRPVAYLVEEYSAKIAAQRAAEDM